MTTDTTSEISENPKKKKQFDAQMKANRKNECDRQQRHCLDLWEMWSRNYRLPPVGAAKENKTEIFEITTLKSAPQPFF